MSRCFAYRAPIYQKKDFSPIGSIEKLQNVRGNTKQREVLSLYDKEKSNKKRPRDEHDKLDSLNHKNKRRKDNAKKTEFFESYQEATKYNSELLERSDLSEEHDPPFVLNHCSSLQSTTKSSHKNGTQNPDANRKQTPGMVLRLKLNSKNPKDQEQLSTGVVPCSTSQDSNSCNIQTALSESTQLQSRSSLAKHPFSQSEEPCFSGRVSDLPILQLRDAIVEADLNKRRHGHRTSKLDRQFRKLIENFKPPPLTLNEPVEEDLDWLFASKRQPKERKSTAQTSKATIFEPIPTDSLQPRACYLPEFDMYQLPYVIPF